eukprot:111581-Alexandrium_andersonii.AAC.1
MACRQGLRMLPDAKRQVLVLLGRPSLRLEAAAGAAHHELTDLRAIGGMVQHPRHLNDLYGYALCPALSCLRCGGWHGP